MHLRSARPENRVGLGAGGEKEPSGTSPVRKARGRAVRRDAGTTGSSEINGVRGWGWKTRREQPEEEEEEEEDERLAPAEVAGCWLMVKKQPAASRPPPLGHH